MENTSKSKQDRRRPSDIFNLKSFKKRCSHTKLDEIFKSPSLDFIGKKRKRYKTDDDSISLQSVDLNLQEPRKKRRSSLAKVTSLANFLSPIRPVKKVQSAFQRSFSLRSLISPSRTPSSSSCSSSTSSTTSSSSLHSAAALPQRPVGTPYRKASTPTPQRRRLSTFWYETVNDNQILKFDKMQIDRQEAIYELFKGEEDMIEDLNMVKTTYHDSMKKLGLLSDCELEQIFGHIDALLPLHQEIVELMKEQRLQDGTIDSVGQVLYQWVPKLDMYVSYCANQVYAKTLLDQKKQDPAVDDFLERCQDSPFSRRLDLWSFLDVPRSKLVKYPLLFKSIQKVTPLDHEDQLYMDRAISIVERIIAQVDHQTGHAKCQFTKSKLDFLDDKNKTSLIEESESVICDGVLKNNRGTKLYVYLFEKVLVLTRPASRLGELRYQVYRQPIPVTELTLEDTGETSTRMGSFKSAFSQTQTNLRDFYRRSFVDLTLKDKNSFKVSFREANKGQSHTLIAHDEHDKRQWMQCLRSVITTNGTPSRQPADGQEDLVNTSITSNVSAITNASFSSNVSSVTNSRGSPTSISAANTSVSRRGSPTSISAANTSVSRRGSPTSVSAANTSVSRRGSPTSVAANTSASCTVSRVSPTNTATANTSVSRRVSPIRPATANTSISSTGSRVSPTSTMASKTSVSSMGSRASTTAANTNVSSMGSRASTTAANTSVSSMGSRASTTAANTSVSSMGSRASTTAANTSVGSRASTTAANTSVSSVGSRASTTAANTSVGSRASTTAANTSVSSVGSRASTTAANTSVGSRASTMAANTSVSSVGSRASTTAANTSVGSRASTTVANTSVSSVGSRASTTVANTSVSSVGSRASTTVANTSVSSVGSTVSQPSVLLNTSELSADEVML